MTLQELLKNDEDKRSNQDSKSGEWLSDGDSMRRRQSLSVAVVTCSSRCRWHHSITASVTGKTGQWHQTQISLLECLLLKSITDSLTHLKNECCLFWREVCIYMVSSSISHCLLGYTQCRHLKSDTEGRIIQSLRSFPCKNMQIVCVEIKLWSSDTQMKFRQVPLSQVSEKPSKVDRSAPNAAFLNLFLSVASFSGPKILLTPIRVVKLSCEF